MARSQLIEQLALHLGAGEAGSLLLKLRLHDLAQLFKAVEPEALGEILVERGFGFDLHRLHGDVESGFLAREMLGLIVGREGDRDGLFLTRLHADQLVFEAGDEGVRTEHQRSVFRLAAVKLDTIELADKVDDQLIALGRLLRLGRVLVALVLRGDVAQRLVDLFVRHRHDETFELEAVDARRFDRGQHFECYGDRGILALGIILVEADFGLHRRTQRLVAEQRVDRFADRVADHLPVQRLAVHLLDEVGGHLARTEAGHAHLRGNLLDLGIDLRGDFACGDGDQIGALEAFVDGLLGLHGNWSDAF